MCWFRLLCDVLSVLFLRLLFVVCRRRVLLAVCCRLSVMFNVFVAVCWLLFVVLVCRPLCFSLLFVVFSSSFDGDCLLFVAFTLLLLVC